MDLRAENIEPFLKRIFGHQPSSSDQQPTNPDGEEADTKERKRRRTTASGNEEEREDRRKSDEDDGESQGGTDCLSSMYCYLHQARTMVRRLLSLVLSGWKQNTVLVNDSELKI